MTDVTEMRAPARRHLGRVIGWSAAALLLATPGIAMLLGAAVDWSAGDFVAAALLIGGLGALVELGAWLSSNLAYRAGVAMAAVTAFLLVWINLAVGIIGSEDHPANQLFLGVLAVAVIGTALARFHPRGMAAAMAAAAVAQGLVGVAAAFLDPRAPMLIGVFVGLWLLAAALFRRAASDGAAPRPTG